MNRYIIEMTDTFGGEANYCWINRFIVSASTMRGAMRKVTNRTCDKVKCVMPGDPERWDSRDACVCYFVEFATDLMVKHYLEDYSHVEVVQ